MAQARLGPGRIHHCMRTIGQCELALAMMCDRTLERHAFGKYLADFANVQEWIAESRLEIDQARLLVLRAAWRLDQGQREQARADVAAIKVVAARLQTRVVNRAIRCLARWVYRPTRLLRISGPGVALCNCLMARTKCTCAAWPDMNWRRHATSAAPQQPTSRCRNNCWPSRASADRPPPR